jgi:hypothetical protein
MTAATYYLVLAAILLQTESRPFLNGLKFTEKEFLIAQFGLSVLFAALIRFLLSLSHFGWPIELSFTFVSGAVEIVVPVISLPQPVGLSSIQTQDTVNIYFNGIDLYLLFAFQTA